MEQHEALFLFLPTKKAMPLEKLQLHAKKPSRLQRSALNMIPAIQPRRKVT
jgi:hypothetical protein